MDKTELRNNINLILNEELRSYQAKGRSTSSLGSFNIGLQSEPNQGWTTRGSVPTLLFDGGGNPIESSNATTLLKFYRSLNNNGKQDFTTHLLSHLDRQSQYASIGYFTFFALHQAGETTSALKTAQENLAGDSVHGYSNVLAILSLTVAHEYLKIEPKIFQEILLILQKFLKL